MSTRTIIAIMILLGIYIAVSYDSREAAILNPMPVVCTQEAKQCPDGSYVGRSGPQCQFADCPPFTGPITPKEEFGTIKGSVGLVPACGGPVRNPPDPNCIFKAYQTNVLFTASDGSVYQTNSNVNGEYSIKLKKGNYAIQAQGGSRLPSCPKETVTLVADQTLAHDISCDSGIR